MTIFLHFSQKITFSEQFWDSVGRRISFHQMATEKIFTLLEPECSTPSSMMKIFKEFLTNVIRIGGTEEEEDLASNIEKPTKQLMDSFKVICWWFVYPYFIIIEYWYYFKIEDMELMVDPIKHLRECLKVIYWIYCWYIPLFIIIWLSL